MNLLVFAAVMALTLLLATSWPSPRKTSASKARALCSRGARLYAQGRHHEAARSFRAALRAPSAGIDQGLRAALLHDLAAALLLSGDVDGADAALSQADDAAGHDEALCTLNDQVRAAIAAVRSSGRATYRDPSAHDDALESALPSFL